MSDFKVTKEMILDRIESSDTSVLPNTTVTICNITLDNGFSVRGESACIDPANFDSSIGAEIAYNNAFDKLWSLFGFMLMEYKHQGIGCNTPRESMVGY